MNNHLHIGSSDYPEHWEESDLANGICLMKEAGFSVARMGKFARLEKAISQLAKAEIASVIRIPTGAPLGWLMNILRDRSCES